MRGQKNKPPFLEDLPSIIAERSVPCQAFVRKPVRYIKVGIGPPSARALKKNPSVGGGVIYCTPDKHCHPRYLNLWRPHDNARR